jgi:hypothetical protein
MGLIVPAAESLESPKEEAEVNWKKSGDKTGFIYSGKNSFKSGEGEFTAVGQGDSFAGSHAYLLLADVPGASANSGASITAEDSNGKAAFVSAETRGTTEQEASVGAGSELKTLISNSGSSGFLQLAAEAKRKISFGTTKLKFVASKIPEGPKAVTHGLGTTPLIVVATSTNNVVTVSASGYNATQFSLWGGNWFEPLTGEVSVQWLAIG